MTQHDEIKQMVQSEGWRIVQEFFKEEFEGYGKEIKTEGKRFEDIAVELMAKQEAQKMVARVVNKITRIGSTVEIKKESYK